MPSATDSPVREQAEPPVRSAGLVLDDVHAGYGGVSVLRGITLEVAPGECVALLGPNGVGKTTTIRTITGVLAPTSGRVEFEGRSLAGVAPHEIVHRGVAVIPEGRRLYGGMTVDENLRMGAYALHKREAGARLEEMYELLPRLQEWRGRLAGQLSGGQQQMCAIARALMSRPRLLLVDELSMGLSPAATREVLDVIKMVAARFSPTILLVDQDVEVAAEIASRGYFLDLGQVVASGAMAELVRVDLIKDLYFKVAKDAGADAVAP